MRIAIDTGGTFTDCVYAVDGAVRVLKVPSTPANPAEAVLQAVLAIAGDAPAEVRHGTTVGTNALLERKGARAAFVTTQGFEDTIAIGRQARSKLYNLFFQEEPALAGPGMRFGVSERIASDGSILRKVDEAELRRLTDALTAVKPEAIAVSLLFGFANPANETAVAAALRQLGVPVSVAHEILPEFREYERGSTVLINAYLAPKMQRYLEELNRGLEARGSRLSVMQSSGGILSSSIAEREPVRTILSGPAGGVVGAMRMGQAAGFTKMLTFDMGGTSTDVALVDSAAGLRTTTEFRILGMPVALPMLDIHTVGAGGGSLASFDRGGALKVGPESAGASPGPICYGFGEQPTVTDANLVLGRLAANGLLGGGMKLDIERAKHYLDRAKGPLPSMEKFGEGILRLADAHMVQALRKISVQQGRDPREFVLVSFGGAGPLHACALARALQISKVLVPNFPGALSAYGILVSDVVRDYSRTIMLQPSDERIAQHLRTLREIGQQEMKAEGLNAIAIHSLDVRYAGQGYELNVPWPGDFVAGFHETHRQRYGYADQQRAVEVVNARVRMISAADEIAMPKYGARSGDGTDALLKETTLYWESEWHRAKVYDRAQLHAGDEFAGPAVISEYSATTFLPPGARVAVDESANLLIEVGP